MLKLIRNENFKFHDKTYVHDSIFTALSRLLIYHQGPADDLIKHRENIKNRVEVLEQFRSLSNNEIFWYAEPRIKENYVARVGLSGTNLTDNIRETDKLKKSAIDAFIAYLAINSLDNDRYGELKAEIHNTYTLGNRHLYPTTMEDAIQIAVNFGKKIYKSQK